MISYFKSGSTDHTASLNYIEKEFLYAFDILYIFGFDSYPFGLFHIFGVKSVNPSTKTEHQMAIYYNLPFGVCK